MRVKGFSDEIGEAMKVPIVDALVAYDDPLNGNLYLLKIRNALHVESMPNNLIPPFLMRLAGIEVDECPKFLSPNPTERNHSIFFRDENIRIALKLNGTISTIVTRSPTENEIELVGTIDTHLTPNNY